MRDYIAAIDQAPRDSCICSTSSHPCAAPIASTAIFPQPAGSSTIRSNQGARGRNHLRALRARRPAGARDRITNHRETVVRGTTRWRPLSTRSSGRHRTRRSAARDRAGWRRTCARGRGFRSRPLLRDQDSVASRQRPRGSEARGSVILLGTIDPGLWNLTAGRAGAARDDPTMRRARSCATCGAPVGPGSFRTVRGAVEALPAIRPSMRGSLTVHAATAVGARIPVCGDLGSAGALLGQAVSRRARRRNYGTGLSCRARRWNPCRAPATALAGGLRRSRRAGLRARGLGGGVGRGRAVAAGQPGLSERGRGEAIAASVAMPWRLLRAGLLGLFAPHWTCGARRDRGSDAVCEPRPPGARDARGDLLPEPEVAMPCGGRGKALSVLKWRGGEREHS